ncbi:hypothetical protein ACEQ8H_006004 [Pleosporales sp. CAS-2024a]
MPPQHIRSRKKSNRDRRNSNARGRPILKINPPRIPIDGQPAGEDGTLSFTPPATVTTRSGRHVKALHHADTVYGGEAFTIGLEPLQKANDDDGDGEADHHRGSSPVLLQAAAKKKATPARRPKTVEPAPPAILEDSWPEYQTKDMVTGVHDSHDEMIEGAVDDIIGRFGCGSKVWVELPRLSLVKDDGEIRYSAQLLVRLYMRAHSEERWNICDLVADTWIRAFHAKRDHEEAVNQFDDMGWAFNEPLRNRRIQGNKGYDTKAPDWSRVLDENDPLLDPDVTDFHPELLNQLYTLTSGHCAAQNLWADTMALCGSKLEKRMQMDKRRGIKWNERLVYDIMCSTLRMVRKKLTLKIEEATEGAWCKRYHMHTAHGLPCYRKLAFKRKVAGDDLRTAHDWDVVPMTLVMNLDISEEPTRHDDRDADMEDAHQPDRFENRVAVDEDAEGESDDEV